MNDFINKYRIKHVRVTKDYHNIDYGYKLWSTSTINYRDREEFIEMELPRSAFEELVNIDRKIHDWVQEERNEEYLRKHHSAIAEAYSKYRMLLELYK
jgi:hypothetical protein